MDIAVNWYLKTVLAIGAFQDRASHKSQQQMLIFRNIRTINDYSVLEVGSVAAVV